MRIFFLLILVLIGQAAALAQAWELKKDADSIEVFTRTVSKSPVKEYKAIAQIDTSVEEILAVIKDVPAYTNWIEDVTYTEVISRDESAMSFYYQMSLPWPAKDRDLCLDMQIAESEKEITVTLSSNPGLMPVDDDYIRIVEIEGHWIITPIDEEHSLVEQQFLADPAGSLPKWIINMFLVDSPFQTMKNLREYVKAD